MPFPNPTSRLWLYLVILLQALSKAYAVTEEEYHSKPGEYKHNWMGQVCPPSATQNGEPDWVIKGLKLDKGAGDMYDSAHWQGIKTVLLIC